ncbi:helix-turn-helix domain-containing protein [uncultured Alistipes sp.]|uniref:helix-turn-helix domain-containing protein n=1 Tax=uncultured Alistipes sp. TaxID=538949 RepID=UPI00258E05E4|nr:helix-turn-helix transcriptional regulator [uncultured Alistipes sp.]
MELRVKELCKEKGLQMQELADKLGITRITLTRNISGNPTISTLENIAAALGVPVPELFAPQPTNTITCPHCGKSITIKAE